MGSQDDGLEDGGHSLDGTMNNAANQDQDMEDSKDDATHGNLSNHVSANNNNT